MPMRISRSTSSALSGTRPLIDDGSCSSSSIAWWQSAQRRRREHEQVSRVHGRESDGGVVEEERLVQLERSVGWYAHRHALFLLVSSSPTSHISYSPPHLASSSSPAPAGAALAAVAAAAAAPPPPPPPAPLRSRSDPRPSSPHGGRRLGPMLAEQPRRRLVCAL